MARTPAPKKKRFAWVGQVRDNYRMTREHYPSLGWVMLGIFVGVLAVFVAVGFLFRNVPTFAILGVSSGLLAAMFYFSRRAMKAAYRSVENQPGGAAAVTEAMRGNWSTTPGVAVTRNQDLVHRIVGRPGVILVSEGPPTRVKHMLTSERKRTQRFIPDTPIHEIQVGSAEGQIPVAKLQKTITKLPKALTPAEVTEVRRRLDALAGQQQAAPVPKGPVPRSPKAARAQMRGQQR